MICIIRQDPTGKITGWLTATDVPEARRRAQSAMDSALAGELYRREFALPPGIYPMQTPACTMLVD